MKIPSFGLPEDIPVRKLIRVEHGDKDLYFVFPNKPILPSMLLLTPSELKTELINVYEVSDPSRVNNRLGYAFECAGNLKVEDQLLMSYTYSFSHYKLSDILATSNRFETKYQLEDFHYLTYPGKCSVILVAPPDDIIERLE